jgi:hypothetical protein
MNRSVEGETFKTSKAFDEWVAAYWIAEQSPLTILSHWHAWMASRRHTLNAKHREARK